MRKILLYILTLLPVLAIAQSTDQNWVKSKTYKDSTKTSIASPTAAQAVTQVSYFDGLGRPIQQVAYAQSNSGKDIVTHIGYDALGRQTKEFLPYINQSASLNFNSNAATDVLGFYNTAAYENTQNPFSEKQFEASPLNRVLKQAAPGEAWKMTSGNTGHEIKFDYQACTPADAIQIFTLTSNWDVNQGLYEIPTSLTATLLGIPQLYKTITKDENWISGSLNTTEEFKNNEGQVVLKRTFNEINNVTVAHDTYYVYDQFGNLTFVIPPAVDTTINITQQVLENMCYQYKYDNRNRLVEKRLPGKQWEYIVYDKLDRVVATGPAYNPYGVAGINPPKGWMLTKYDAFNRPVYTGWYNAAVSNTTDRKTLQTSYNIATVFSESKTLSNNTIDGIATRYSNVVSPSTFILLTVNYYDTYDYPNAPTPFPTSVESQVTIDKAKGMPTGSWVRVLDVAGSTTNELSYTVYDDKFRPVRSYTKNYSGGYTQVDSKLDWAGKTLYTFTYHKRLAISTELVTKDMFEYSPQDKLVKHKHKIINSQNLPEQLLTLNTYDELGQLISKKVGGTDITGTNALQKVDYGYNIRGWLKGINDITNLAPTTENDLFSFKINYNDYTAQGLGDTQGTALFNGNISSTYWKTAGDNVLRKYKYSYDKLNRLLEANYNKPENNTTTNNYLEKLTYDKNGNIQTIKRNGGLDPSGGSPANEIDNLIYTYDGINKNLLKKVVDSNTSPQGFKDSAANTTEDYTYDLNGNMITDNNKNITEIVYNHLNLPTKITFGTTGNITYIYNSVGQKVEKKVTQGTTITTTNYLSGFQYKNTVLQFFPHAEGYVNVKPGSIFNYVFNYTDHLGNIRISYAKDLTTNTLKILEENHYYAFGLKHTNYNVEELDFDELGTIKPKTNPLVSTSYQYKYNGKELQEELGLNMTAMDFRQYDSTIGRFVGMDLLSESSSSVTPYHFGYNNPVFWADPSGLLSQGAIDAMWNATGKNGRSTWTNNGFGFSSGNRHIDYEGSEIIEPIGVSGTFHKGSGRFTYDSDNLVGGFKYDLAGKVRDHIYARGSAYQTRRDKITSRQWDDFQSGLDYAGSVPVIGEPIDFINGGISLVRGRTGAAVLSFTAMAPVAGNFATALKIQKHHIIPKAVFNELSGDLAGVMKRDGASNLVNLPAPFHGNHPAYSDYVRNALNQMKSDVGITPGSIQSLQGNLRGMIDDAQQSGMKLNDYFKQFK